jgi:hypothetical protein
MLTKIFIILVIVGAVIYWRGSKLITEEKGWECNWHGIYAVCMTNSQRVLDAKSPSFMEIMKAGSNFKNGFKF